MNRERMFIRSLGNIESIPLFYDFHNSDKSAISFEKRFFSLFVFPLI
jgi:hypothetical protein